MGPLLDVADKLGSVLGAVTGLVACVIALRAYRHQRGSTHEAGFRGTIPATRSGSVAERSVEPEPGSTMEPDSTADESPARFGATSGTGIEPGTPVDRPADVYSSSMVPVPGGSYPPAQAWRMGVALLLQCWPFDRATTLMITGCGLVGSVLGAITSGYSVPDFLYALALIPILVIGIAFFASLRREWAEYIIRVWSSTPVDIEERATLILGTTVTLSLTTGLWLSLLDPDTRSQWEDVPIWGAMLTIVAMSAGVGALAVWAGKRILSWRAGARES